MRLPPPAVEEFRHFAESVVSRARALSLPAFRSDMLIKLKDDESPVTAVDRDVETLIRGLIQATYPEHGILGEEHGARHADAEYVWSIDPIDGTRSFITGWPLWGTLLALLHNGVPLLGVVDMPVLNERWVGIRDGATTLNGTRCRSRRRGRLADATLYATSPDIFSPSERETFERICRAAQSRRFGGDCYSYALLASGQIDAVVEANLKPYDYLPLVPVIESAGGVITDWQGQPLGIHSDGCVIAAASAELHREILALTATNNADAMDVSQATSR
jgi:histidinol phosphatase-like enzyme (inositol monophosphatase family)